MSDNRGEMNVISQRCLIWAESPGSICQAAINTDYLNRAVEGYNRLGLLSYTRLSNRAL